MNLKLIFFIVLVVFVIGSLVFALAYRINENKSEE